MLRSDTSSDVNLKKDRLRQSFKVGVYLNTKGIVSTVNKSKRERQQTYQAW